jgi:outer membrane protein assembly factor BamB
MDWLVLAGFLPWTAPQSTESLFDGEFSGPPALHYDLALPIPPGASGVSSEYAAPVLHGTEVWLGVSTEPSMVALDRATGILSRKLPADAPVQGSPVIAGDRIHFSDTAGTVFCYTLSTGELIWKRATGAPVLSTVTLDGERLYVSNVDDVVYALSTDTGELLWRYEHRSDPSRRGDITLFGSPKPLANGDRVYVGFSDGSAVALTREEGVAEAATWIGSGRYPDIIASIVAADEGLIISGFDRPLVRLSHSLEAPEWEHDVGGSSAVLVDDGKIYHGGGDGVLRSMDAESGTINWEWDSETSSVLTTPMLLDAGLLVGAAAGSLYLVAPEDGALVWSHVPEKHMSGIMGQPAVQGRQMVALTNAGRVVSFLVPAEAKKSVCVSIFCDGAP